MASKETFREELGSLDTSVITDLIPYSFIGMVVLAIITASISGMAHPVAETVYECLFATVVAGGQLVRSLVALVILVKLGRFMMLSSASVLDHIDDWWASTPIYGANTWMLAVFPMWVLLATTWPPLTRFIQVVLSWIGIGGGVSMYSNFTRALVSLVLTLGVTGIVFLLAALVSYLGGKINLNPFKSEEEETT